MPKKPKKAFYLDYGILIPYVILSLIGVMMSFSASSYRLMSEEKNWWMDGAKQGAFLLLSLVAVLLIYKMRTKVYQKKKFIMTTIFAISALLVITKLFATATNGAQGWLYIGPIGLQPAEFLKIMVVWYLAYILARRQSGIVTDFKNTVTRPLVLVGILISLVLIQPDAGGAAILVLITLVLVFASGVSYWYSVLSLIGGVGLSTLLIEFILWTKGKIFPDRFQYIYKRFAAFRNPFIDVFGDGHQMVNSYYAMFNGGWFGRGLGNSIQKKGFLPEAHSDFMFSIVLEELGLVVGIGILLLLMFLILRIIMTGIKATTPFNSLMCLGIGGMMLIQTFINIGGITGIIPLTGVTFPFISQGGSSLLSLSIGIGFVLNIRADELRKRHQISLKQRGELIELPMV